MVEGQPLTIGALAKHMGLRPSTLRYYERRGILPRPQRLSNGYRIYDQHALTYLRLVRQSRTLGITLKDARNLIRLLEEDRRPCEQVHMLVGKRLREVEAAIRDLAALRRKLRMALRATSPGRCRPTDLCPN